METLAQIIKDSGKKKVVVGHFNISDTVTLRAIFEAARELSARGGSAFGGNVPVIIGTSEGEREFLGAKHAVALVKNLREEYNFPIFINADHTHSLDKVREAVEAGYDAILFDGGKLPFEENIAQTKEVVDYVKSKNSRILVEGELGYIGSSSEILKELPKGAAIAEKDLTTSQEALEFVKKTGVDMLAPAVGNIHGMFANAPNPNLNIKRIKEIKTAVKIPLVLHGGSGTPEGDFLKAIEAGINIIHISTELRAAWRKGLDETLKDNPDEVAPYKLMKPALDSIKMVVYNRLKLFNRI